MISNQIDMYGIKNCSTVKKALIWLAERNLEERGLQLCFHDYKKEGVSPALLTAWSAVLGWEALLNKSGTTFRNLPEAAKADLDEERALALMVASPSLIRRPLLSWRGRLLLRFSPESYEDFFSKEM